MDILEIESSFKPDKRQIAISFKLLAEVLGRVAQFGTLGLVARTLSLAEFGIYGLALVLGFLLAQVADFGLHLLVTRQLGRDSATDFAGQAFATKLGLMTALLILSVAGLLITGYGLAFGLLLIASLLYSLADFGFAVLRAHNQLHYEAGLVILYRLTLLAGAGLVFVTGTGLLAIAFTYLLATLIVVIPTLKIAHVKPYGGLDGQLLLKAAPIGLAIMLSLLAFKIDVPLLQFFTGNSAEVGLYNAAYKLFEPLLLFPAAVMAGLFPPLSKAALEWRQSKQPILNFSRQTRRLLLLLGLSGIVVGVGVALVAGWVVPLLFGNGFEEAILTLRLLALAVPFLFVNSGLTHALLALERERVYLYFFGVCLLVNIGANALLIPWVGRNGAALATLLTEVCLTIMCAVALRMTIRTKVDKLPTPITESRWSSLTKITTWKIEEIGFGLLLALVLCLPFELNQHPFISFEPWLVLNDLKLLYYVNIIAAIFTLWKRRNQWKSSWLNWHNVRLWLGLLVIECAISTVFSVVPKESFKFTSDLVLGAILWLALPLWLTENREAKLRWLSYALVGSATVSAGLGLLEFVPGLKLDNWLLSPFKEGATVAGPFLRLSGTFEYANIAAIFYELTLPFALVNLAGSVAHWRTKRLGAWQIVLWTVACGVLWEALLLSFSRSALPGMLVAAPLIWWSARRNKFKEWWPGLSLGLGLGIVLVGISLLLSPVLVLRFKTQSDQGWYLARYNSPVLSGLTVCQELQVPVTVHNLTPLDWDGGPNGSYHLSYHWLDQTDHIYQFEGLRSVMPTTLKAGQQAVVTAQLRTPDKSGHYFLVWDVVEEDVSWFSLKSASYQRQEVEVVTSPAATCNLPARPGSKSPLASLPNVPPNPERSQLWQVAQQMIKAKPLLGVGPDAYRFAYGAYTGLKVWDTRIFANSTPLELAADLGISGLILFVIFGLAAVWPLVKNAWSGKLGLIEAATLAALVAFGLHGLLDYFLGFHAIFILLWLLLAIATSFQPAPMQTKETM